MIVACNDTSAYVWGMSCGKTRLIALSPNKTLEGFVGGAISTFVFSFMLMPYVFRVDYLICPYDKLQVEPFVNLEGPSCRPNRETYDVKNWNAGLFTFEASQAQLYVCVIALFTSIVGPFGGFLASGMKRAYQLKDFANTLPGHGGFTDRFDCHSVIIIFAYILMS
jgi:phosphatidate cytidylyltransferase